MGEARRRAKRREDRVRMAIERDGFIKTEKKAADRPDLG